MKVNNKKMALIGLAASTLFGVAGCGRNEEPDVYGVPIPTTVTEQQNIAEGVYGPPDQMMPESTEGRTESTDRTESTERRTEYDYDKMSEEELAELEDRRNDVSDILMELIRSEEFTNADVDTRIKMFYAKLEDLSVNGTEKYPDPIIKKDSWQFNEEYGEIVYEYIDGIPHYWDVTDKMKEIIQESTDVELP